MTSENTTSLAVRQEIPGINGQTPLVQGDIVTGRVVEVAAQQSIQTRSGKWIALMTSGTPYEFGTQTHKTTLFVEPINAFGNDVAAEQRALVVFGDISGSVAKGHIVQAKVKERNGMLVVQQLNNLTTHSSIQPAAQADGKTVLVTMLVGLAAFAFIAWTAFDFVASGRFMATVAGLAGGLLDAFGPVLISGGLLFLLVKSFIK